MPSDVPAPLHLVESFLNSVDVETGGDDLVEPDRFRRWLRDHDRPAAVTGEDLALARALRTELRAEAAGHHDGEPRDHRALDRLAAKIPLVATFTDTGATPAPTGTGVTRVLGEILAAVVLASHDGTWRRVKVCRATDCRYVYYDGSRNSSRRWCSMRVCGNRAKTRAYRQRAAT
jgi:predicted RNA-binding Zn ribbon-like protein